MTLVLITILAPIAAGLLLLFLRSDAIRKLVVSSVVAAVCISVVSLIANPPAAGSGSLPWSTHHINLGLLLVEIVVSLFIVYIGIRAKNMLAVLLAVAQGGLMTWFEITAGQHIAAGQNLFVDKFALIMALINGVVGGGICIYAVSYMREYHDVAHREVRDRRPLFFAVLLGFVGVMFGLIYSNNLMWMYLFWELTTLCSFLLIGYTQTAESKRNAMRALVMNLSGGLAFALAIVWLQRKTGSIELQSFIGEPRHEIVLLPAALLCFAGMTKAAQLPFSSWLLGAMVAPTPVSALLHSSTMVKAGVYLVLRLAPVIVGTKIGFMVALVGGVTFVIASITAITVRDAKRVLAYSTVANLGLIVLCGGIGTAEAVWAGVLLIIFHAVAKCLLFLCVGVIEHKLHSRDIESMAGLIIAMPRVAGMMEIGIAGMFLAPFGMLISKWAVLKAVVEASPLLSVFIVFGSAATLFFWVKWLGKLIEVIQPPPRVKNEMALGEAIPMFGLSIATFAACLLFPLISSRLIEPYIASVYGQAHSLPQGNVIIMIIMMSFMALFPICFFYRYDRGVRVTDAYLGGANVRSSVRFLGSANQVENVAISNYYFRDFLSETSLTDAGVVATALLVAVMFAAACL